MLVRRFDVMRYLLSLTLLCAASLGLSCATVEDITDDLERAGESFSAIGGSSESRPDPTDCVENQTRCLGTRLQSRPAGRSGHSLCQDCHQRCIALGTWPSKLDNGQTSEWWRHE